MLDEPTNSLDKTAVDYLSELIANLSKKAIVIFTTHDQDFLTKVKPNILELDESPINKFIQKAKYA